MSNASDLIVRLNNRAATGEAVGASIPEYALPKEVVGLLREAAQQIDHQINIALAWEHTARGNSIALRDLEARRLQCLRCGTVDAFGPISPEKK